MKKLMIKWSYWNHVNRYWTSSNWTVCSEPNVKTDCDVVERCVDLPSNVLNSLSVCDWGMDCKSTTEFPVVCALLRLNCWRSTCSRCCWLGRLPRWTGTFIGWLTGWLTRLPRWLGRAPAWLCRIIKPNIKTCKEKRFNQYIIESKTFN